MAKRTVWLVEAYDDPWEPSWPVAVFSNKDLANKYVENYYEKFSASELSHNVGELDFYDET